MTTAPRVLVVGASSGIGRALALLAARDGAQVVASARRAERLDTLVAEGGGRIAAVAADVRQDADCRRLVDEAVATLGGLDAFVYAAGLSPLGSLLDVDGVAWREVMETNVIGAALTCRAALPHMAASGGRVAFLSSISSEDPRPMLVPYGVSKAALDALVKGWRSEHPGICFLRVGVGPTVTEFGAGWAPEQVAKFSAVREERGLVRARPMSAEETARAVLEALRSRVWVEDIRLMPVNAANPG